MNNNLVASHDFVSVAGLTTERAVLDALVNLDAGLHEIRFQITRPYLTGTAYTPLQYIDNIAAVCPPTDARTDEWARLEHHGIGGPGR